MPNLPERRNIRLPNRDYSSPGSYFVTVISFKRTFLFGDVIDGKIVINENGWIVETCWKDLPNHYPNIQLGAFVVMPNHIHGIIKILDRNGHGLSEIVRGLKSYSSLRINKLSNTTGTPVWHRSYHERVIRTKEERKNVERYIQDNPKNWEEDEIHVGPTRIDVGTGL